MAEAINRIAVKPITPIRRETGRQREARQHFTRSFQQPESQPRPSLQDIFKQVLTPTNARQTLKDIALWENPKAAQPETPKPTPQTPQAAETAQSAPAEPSAPETQPDSEQAERDKIDGFLKEAAGLLIEIKDARAALAILGLKAANNTLLGKEFRGHVLASIQEMDIRKFSPEQQKAFTKLKDDIASVRPLPQPETPPQNTELYKFLQGLPENEQAKMVMDALKGGAPELNAIMIAINNPDFKAVGAELEKILFKGDMPKTPEEFLNAAGLEANDENLKAMEDILNPKNNQEKSKTNPAGNYAMIMLALLIGSTQMLGPILAEAEGDQSGGRGGH